MEEQYLKEPNSQAKAKAKPNNDSDDDTPTLSSQALAALKEFLAEQNSHSIPSTPPKTGTESDNLIVSLVSEDWRLSQFWYQPETAHTVAQEVLSLCQDSEFRVACIACPTLYAYLKKMGPHVNVQLLEYDKRFEQYGSDYTFYDYNQPEELPLDLKHAFQIVVADPPYLSKECLEKVAQTTSFLARSGECYLLLLTGAVQKDSAAELLGLRPCGFRPQHSSKLGNEFRLFTDYDPGIRLGGWEQEE
ncbi:N6-adenineMlase domain-containing protein [Cephalotus follicularis]|uniref:Protein-lysine N-methyltransferase CFOL_v3_29559 n=1 Tax=Cephalotus follicularis TaxID=3775 RepID=A0A1Q3D0U7_CEPFO|nr:N6-adenineMlase domain-containing protein [Cephalotus follicularis]